MAPRKGRAQMAENLNSGDASRSSRKPTVPPTSALSWTMWPPCREPSPDLPVSSHCADFSRRPNGWRTVVAKLKSGRPGGLKRTAAGNASTASDDMWMPEGILKPNEVRPDEEAPEYPLAPACQSAPSDWRLAKTERANTPNWDIASTCTIDGEYCLPAQF